MMVRVIRNAAAAALIAAIPVSMTVASVRPSAAVPVAGSTAVAAQVMNDDRRGGLASTWPIWLFGAGMLVLVLIEIIDDDDDFALTRG
jgi:hypothetical protein